MKYFAALREYRHLLIRPAPGAGTHRIAGCKIPALTTSGAEEYSDIVELRVRGLLACTAGANVILTTDVAYGSLDIYMTLRLYLGGTEIATKTEIMSVTDWVAARWNMDEPRAMHVPMGTMLEGYSGDSARVSARFVSALPVVVGVSGFLYV